MHKWWLLVVVFMLVLPLATAITVTPLTATISSPQPNQGYSFILTIINDGSNDLDIDLMVDPRSFYLTDYVTLEPSNFNLAPSEKVNVAVALTVPSDISPEDHILYITPMAEGRLWDSFEVFFTIPGDQFHNLTITKVFVPDTTADLSANIDIELTNNGNVIARATPRIGIISEGVTIDTVEGKGEIMVMPGDSYNVSILYDPALLTIGTYETEVLFVYNDWRQTNKMKSEFHIVKYLDLPEGVERKTITEGETVEIELALQYNQNTEYKVHAVIPGTDIVYEDSGTFVAGQEILTFELPTELLGEGDYKVEVTVTYGPNYSQSVSNDFQLRIKSKKSRMMQLILLIVAGAIVIGLLAKMFIFSDNDARRRQRLLNQITAAEARYNALQAEASSIITEVNGFVTNSNTYFRNRHAGKYEFN